MGAIKKNTAFLGGTSAGTLSTEESAGMKSFEKIILFAHVYPSIPLTDLRISLKLIQAVLLHP